MDKSPANNVLIQAAFPVVRFIPQIRFAGAVSARERGSACGFPHFGKPFLAGIFTCAWPVWPQETNKRLSNGL